jgi:hypothetical protein
MLTFFEYLRNRAYESIVAGANDALEFLEKEKLDSAVGRADFVGPPRKRKTVDHITAGGSAPEDEIAQDSDHSRSAEETPRRRGRPAKSQAGDQ